MTDNSMVVLKRGALAPSGGRNVQTVTPLKKVDYRIVPFGGGVLPNARHIAELHAELLPRSPLTKLGVGFMERFYYKRLPKQGLIFGAIAYVDGHPAGFVSATYDSDRRALSGEGASHEGCDRRGDRDDWASAHDGAVGLRPRRVGDLTSG